MDRETRAPVWVIVRKRGGECVQARLGEAYLPNRSPYFVRIRNYGALL